MAAFVTVLQAADGRPANKRISIVDGRPVKRALADRGSYVARTVRADTPEEFAAVLREAGGAPACLISLGHVPAMAPKDGARFGEIFRFIPRSAAARALGLPDKAPAAEIDAAFGDEPRVLSIAGTEMLCVTRTKNFLRYGGWMLFDRDPSDDMPADIAQIVRDDALWLAAMERIAPGIGIAGRVRLRSSTGRVLWNGSPLPAAGSHEYVRLDVPDAVGAVGRALMVAATLAGLIWAKSSHDKKTGEVVATTSSPIWDPTTFSPERLVFVGAPVIEGDGLQLTPPRIEVFPGGALPVDAVPEPEAEDLAEAARKTGASFRSGQSGRKGNRVASSPVSTAADLTLDTAVEFAGHGAMTVREACIKELRDERAQVPEAFRTSASMNAMFWYKLGAGGTPKPPVVWDRGARVVHVLTAAARAEWEVEFLLPPVVDAPPPPATMTMRDAEIATEAMMRSWLTEAFDVSEQRMAHVVWGASWDKAIRPPDAFLPRPEPLRLAAMRLPVGKLEMAKISTSVGKTRAFARVAPEMLAAAPTVRGVRRRIFVVAKDHRAADEMAEAIDKAAEQMAVTVSRYRGLTADNPSTDEKMCPRFQARQEASAAGLSSSRACSVRSDDSASPDDAEHSDDRRVYCARHPHHPTRTEPACGWASQDLGGDIVIFAGWSALTRAMSDPRLRRYVTLTQPETDRAPAKEARLQIAPCDALLLDETDLSQLLAGAAAIGHEEGEGDAPSSMKVGALPDRVWPDMFTVSFAEWSASAPDEMKAQETSCARLLGEVGDILQRLDDNETLSPAVMAGIASTDEWHAASKWAWKGKENDNALVRPNMSAKALRAVLERLRRHNRMIGSAALLLRLIGEMVEFCPEDVTNAMVRVRDGKVEMRYARRLASWCVDVPTLLADATGDLTLLRMWWPDAAMRTEITAEWAPEGVEHVVAVDFSGSYSQLTPGQGEGDDDRRGQGAAAAAGRLADAADVLAWLFDGKVMLAQPMALEEAARAKVRTAAGKDAHWLHFGAARGLNVAEDDRAAMTTGRPLPPSWDVETTAALLRHGHPVADDQRGYARVPSYHRMADGTARLGYRYGHKDELADAVLRLVTQSELEQVEQRARMLRRDAGRPLLMLSVSNLALEDGRRVDRLVSASAIRRINPEVVAASLGVIVRRDIRGAMGVLASVLDPEGVRADPKVAASRLLDELRRWLPAGLWEAALAARAGGDATAGSPEALAAWSTLGEGWAHGARLKVTGEAARGMWWSGRVRLVGGDTAVGVAVRGATQVEAEANLLARVAGVAVVEWDAVGPTAGARGDEPARPASGTRASAGGGTVERARAMVEAGLVPMRRDHAVLLYPRLFATPDAAKRAIWAAEEMLEKACSGCRMPGSYECGRASAKSGFAYIRYTYLGKTRLGESSATFAAGPFRPWRYRAGKAGKPATVWLAVGQENEAKARFEAVLGPLSVWREARATPGEPEPAPVEPAAQPPMGLIDPAMFYPRVVGALPMPPESGLVIRRPDRPPVAVSADARHRPPHLWGDEFDGFRLESWRARQRLADQQAAPRCCPP